MSLEAMRALADQGKLKPDSLVTRVGMADWVPCGASVPELFPLDTIVRPPLLLGVGQRQDVLRGLTDRLRRSIGADDVIATLPHLRAVRFLLEALRRGLTERSLDATDRVGRQAGHVAYVAAAVILVLAFMVLGIRSDSVRLFFVGLLILAPAAVVLHFLVSAALFLDVAPRCCANRRASWRRRPSSPLPPWCSWPYCCSAPRWESTGSSPAAPSSCSECGWRFRGAALCVRGALNPASVNVTAGADISAGEEALGIGMFLVKLRRLVSFLFGVGSVIGLCTVVYLFYLVFAREPLFLIGPAQQMAYSVLGVALGPFLSYLGFALSYLLVDLLRAILRTPARIDALREDLRGDR